MAPDGAPPLEETAVKIAEAIQSIHLDLLPSIGIGIAQVPPEFTDALGAVAQAAGNLGGDFYQFSHYFNTFLDQYADDFCKPYLEAVETIRDDVLTPFIESWNETFLTEVENISLNVWCIESDLFELYQTMMRIETILQYCCERLNQRLQELTDATAAPGETKVHRGNDWEKLSEEVLKQIEDKKKEWLKKEYGKPEWLDMEDYLTVGGSHAEARASLVDQFLGKLAPDEAGIWSWIRKLLKAGTDKATDVAAVVLGAAENAVAGGPGAAAGARPGGAPQLTRTLMSCLNWLTPGGVATPDTALNRCTAAYLFNIAMGEVASAIAAVASVDILGCGDLNVGYLTAMLGQFASFNTLGSAVQGNFYRAFISEPLRYYTNRLARPYLPSVGDLQRFRYKRIFNPPAGAPTSTPPPLGFREAMAYWGYSDPWIAVYENDLYREPMARDLLLMAEVATFTDDWWAYKIKRLGYDDSDAPLMVEAFKRRAARTQILDLYNQLRDLRRQGFIDDSTFRDRCQATKLVDMAVDFGAQAATVYLERREKEETVDSLKDQFDRDMIDESGLRTGLDGILAEPGIVNRMVALAKVRKYRKVYWKTPEEEAREALADYRRAFLANQITGPEYKAKMIEAGLEPDLADLRFDLDDADRQAKVLAEFQRYRLPRLRDEVLHGFLSLSEYRGELADAGFPDDYLDDEVALVQAMAIRRQQQTVRAEQLPPYRRSYVVGLISRDQLRSAMVDAGMTGAGIEAELQQLTYQRDLQSERRTLIRARGQAADRRDPRAVLSRETREAERGVEAQTREAARAEAAALQGAGAAALALVDDAIDALWNRRGDPLAPAFQLPDAIPAAFANQGAWCPDDVWGLLLALADQAERGGDADQRAVLDLLGRLALLLAPYAGLSAREIEWRRRERELEEQGRLRDVIARATPFVAQAIHILTTAPPGWPATAAAELATAEGHFYLALITPPDDTWLLFREAMRALGNFPAPDLKLAIHYAQLLETNLRGHLSAASTPPTV